jgi:hypothetical protein
MILKGGENGFFRQKNLAEKDKPSADTESVSSS